jgi:FkbM family methyltransferase
MKSFLTYAQCYEDWILYCALSGVENGFYVDVGANDPWEYSVTKAFYERGWCGINIEPLEEGYKKLCEERPRDINLNIGVGSEEGILEFFISGPCTTCSSEVVRINKMEESRRIKVPVKPLAEILARHVRKDQDIHFLKIDVEGFERSVLEGMDFSCFRPWILTVEATFPLRPVVATHEAWEDLLLSQGYQHVYSDQLNRYYVDATNDEWSGIIKKNLDEIDHLSKQYCLYKPEMIKDPEQLVDQKLVFECFYFMLKYYKYVLVSTICPIKLFKNKIIKYRNRISAMLKS